MRFLIIAILVNNAFKTVQQRAKDKEDICRRAVIKRRKHQWKQQKKIWNMGNTSTKVLSMK